MSLNVGSSIVLALAAFMVVFNWRCVVASYRFRRQGIDRHVSTVPAVAQVLVLVAAFISSSSPSPLVPGWVFCLVALSDVALLQVLYLPVFLLRRKFRAQI